MPEAAPTSPSTASSSDTAPTNDRKREGGDTGPVERRGAGVDWSAPIGTSVWLRHPNGHLEAEWRFPDLWSAVHHFSRMVARENSQRLGLGATLAVVDRDGRELAAAMATGRDEQELRFSNPATQDLYRQANRERQLALNEGQLTNRITALGPKEQRPADRGQMARPDSDDAPKRSGRFKAPEAQTDPRRVVTAFLDDRDPPGTIAQSDQRRLDEAILDRADEKSLQRLASLAQAGDMDAVQQGLSDIRKQVEAQVNAAPGAPTRRPDPPLDERFTRDDGLAHTNWWFREAPDRLAFQERWLSLRTAVHSPAAIQAMVERAQENGWSRLYVEGSGEFRRDAWIHATARNLAVVGYTPTRGDRESVDRERLTQARASQRQQEGKDPVSQPPTRTPPMIKAHRERKLQPATRSTQDIPRDLDLLLAKAFKDSKVPATLQAVLRASVAHRVAKGQDLVDGRLPVARVYDVRASRTPEGTAVRPTQEPALNRSGRDRNR